MCGRFTLILEPEAVQKELDLGEMPPDLQPRYNIAPTQPVAVVTDPVERRVEVFRWGLIPSWAKDPEIGNRMINARSETVSEKPAFRTSFARRRCAILADGFFEWVKQDRGASGRGRRSSPYFIHLASGKPFAFAGLWDSWRSPEGEEVQSCTIITCPANEAIATLHDRMPVILDKDHIWQWLEPLVPQAELQSMLVPYPAEKIAYRPISYLVNNPAYDSPEVMAAPVD